MIQILKKIMSTGVVTEDYDKGEVPARFRGQITIENGECKNCRRCIASCPTKAIREQAGSLIIDHKACLFCGRCVERCGAEQLKHTSKYKLATCSSIVANTGTLLGRKIQSILGRSLHIRHVDAGSCNACDFEMNALSNPFYDLQQYGIDFVASPRHADMLMVTGVVTRNLTQALLMTYEAMPTPNLVMAVGACAASGQVFGSSYAIRGAVDKVLPVDIYVPGCPPRPQALLYGLLLGMDKL